MIKKLLLIDDDEDDRDFFLEVIDSVLPDVNCETACNGREALDRLINKGDLPEMIFLDLNMPLMNGREFLAALKSRDMLKNIPIVVLSTGSHPATIAEAKLLGATHFITKPAKISLLEKQLQDFFNSLIV